MLTFFWLSYVYYYHLQNEKQVLALLSRLDLQSVHFTETPPGLSFYFSSLSAGNIC